MSTSRHSINVRREYGMCISAGNNSSGEKNSSHFPSAEFFIVMWCIQGPNKGTGNETDTWEVFFFLFKTETMLYASPQSTLDGRLNAKECNR